MSGGLTTPNAVLPRRYILRAGAATRLLCRHARSARCACQGHRHQPAPPPPQSARANARTAAPPPQTQPSREQRSLEKLLAQVLSAIRDFPDAAAAVEVLLDQLRSSDPSAPAPATSDDYA